jgi:hypothetical protein
MSRKNFTSSPARQLGAMTLLEMMGIMLLGLLLAIGGMYALGSSRGSGKMATEADHMRGLLSMIPRMATVNGYGTAGTNLVPTIIARRLYPDGMTVSGNALINRVGGTVAITSTGLGFTISSPGYDAAECGDIATGISGMRGLQTRVNTTNNTGVIDSPTATTQCSGSTNTVAWTSES